jgi:PAS domain S-box-containing protein
MDDLDAKARPLTPPLSASDGIAHRMLASIVESSEDAIVSKDLEGRILTWNAGAERIFGYTAEEAVGSPVTLIVPPELHAEELSILERLRRGERIEHFETVRIDRLGRRKVISLSVSPVRDADGRIVAAAKVARDVTAQKRAEAENARLLAELQDADRRKDEFLAVLAHELRNPLAPLTNALHILRLSDDLPPGVEKLRDIMETQVGHLVRLVDDLLEISRITGGKIELRREPVELSAIVRTAVETSRPLIDAAGHQLAIQVAPEPIILDADPVRLAQVLSNLLNNAAKYTDRGGQIWLSAGLEAGSAMLSVRDNGSGISAEMLPHVFDMFAQVEQTRTKSQGGLGLGLAVARTLVELHGGTITAQSGGPGCGSQFVVRLPVAAVRTAAAPPTGAPFPDRATLPQRRVLVVDDTRVAVYTLGKLLEALGQEVLLAYDAATALQTARVSQPDLVISDIGMPGMDGYELARQLRRLPELSSAVLVALTGYGQDSDRRRALASGFDAHLVKPVSVHDLQELLESLPESSRHQLQSS